MLTRDRSFAMLRDATSQTFRLSLSKRHGARNKVSLTEYLETHHPQLKMAHPASNSMACFFRKQKTKLVLVGEGMLTSFRKSSEKLL